MDPKRCRHTNLAVDTPALVVDLNILEANIHRMADLASEAGVRLRPHAKAHKSVQIARLQLGAGAVGIAVAKVGEAEVMLDAGIRDIMITTPVVGKIKLERLARLIKGGRISVVIDSFEAAKGLSIMADESDVEIEVLLEIDTGLGRCGLLPGKPAADLAPRLARMPGLKFAGLKTAELQVYAESDQNGVAGVVRGVNAALQETILEIEARGIEVPNVCAGSTASVEIERNMPSVTEIQPGSYVFNSLDGINTGAASLENCAMTILATVISRPADDRAIIDAGFKALTRVTVPGMPGFGLVAPYGDAVVLEKLYEEHGLLRIVSPVSVGIGERVEIVPASCSAIPPLFEEFVFARDGHIESRWPIQARGKLS